MKNEEIIPSLRLTKPEKWEHSKDLPAFFTVLSVYRGKLNIL